MSKTVLEVKDTKFYINGKMTYSEIDGSNSNYHGLLMNARFIQGIFDDKEDIERYNRYGKVFDPNKNTDELIQALPQWYNHGLRAFTLGIQGGGPCFTIKNSTISNSPYMNNGTTIDSEYLDRLDRILNAADELGMAVIVSLFYPGQASRLTTATEVVNAVKTVCNHIKKCNYQHIILEICNEYDLCKDVPLLTDPDGIVYLIELAQEILPNTLIGCSLMGGNLNKKIAEASSIVLIHGNNQTRGRYYNMIQKAKSYAPGKPILCNEDSQAIGNMIVSMKEHVSWGYYNNMTKQEPPVYWEILKGEDLYFAKRLAMELGIIKETKTQETYLQGVEEHMTYEDKRWIRLASLYPEKINYVEFYYNGELYQTAYDEPFMINFDENWRQWPVMGTDKDKWSVKIYNL